MKNLILLFALISFFCLSGKISNAQTPDWIWAVSAGGITNDAARSIALDDSGNVYMAGYFNSPSITFGLTTLTNAGNYDIFLTKYDSNSNIIWAKSAGGTNSDMAYSVAVDDSGNAYVSGHFKSQTIIFGSDTLTNTGSGYYDIFIAKYDANGNVQWAKNIGGTVDDEAYSVALDTSGNVYIAGGFSSQYLTIDTITLTNTVSNGSYDVFLAKFNPGGNVLWARNAIGNSTDKAYSIAVDVSQNIFVAGNYQTTITFDTITLPYGGNYNIFLAKYNANGDVLWAKSAGGTGYEKATTVAVDASGNVIVAGYFRSMTIIFGSDTLANTDNTGLTDDLFLAKYDINGNVLWVKSAGGTDDDWANSVTVDAFGNIYLAGFFSSPSIDFGVCTLTNNGSNKDILIAKYNNIGNVQWAKSAVGTSVGAEEAFSVAIDTSRSAYVAGYFYGTTLTFGSTTLTLVNMNDVFLAKLDSDIVTGIHELCNSCNFSLFPNPCTGNINIFIPDKATIEILNMNGQIIKSIIHDSGVTSFDIVDLSGGVYIVRAKTDKEIVTKKFIKQ